MIYFIKGSDLYTIKQISDLACITTHSLCYYNQTIKMVLAEASLIGLFGGLLGLVTGIILSRILFIGMTTMSGYRLPCIRPIDSIILT